MSGRAHRRSRHRQLPAPALVGELVQVDAEALDQRVVRAMQQVASGVIDVAELLVPAAGAGAAHAIGIGIGHRITRPSPSLASKAPKAAYVKVELAKTTTPACTSF